MKKQDEIAAMIRRNIAWDDGIEAGKRALRADENPYRLHRDAKMAERWEQARLLALKYRKAEKTDVRS